MLAVPGEEGNQIELPFVSGFRYIEKPRPEWVHSSIPRLHFPPDTPIVFELTDSITLRQVAIAHKLHGTRAVGYPHGIGDCFGDEFTVDCLREEISVSKSGVDVQLAVARAKETHDRLIQDVTSEDVLAAMQLTKKVAAAADPIEAALEKLHVPDLRALLERHNQPTTGLKPALVQRLLARVRAE